MRCVVFAMWLGWCHVTGNQNPACTYFLTCTSRRATMKVTYVMEIFNLWEWSMSLMVPPFSNSRRWELLPNRIPENVQPAVKKYFQVGSLYLQSFPWNMDAALILWDTLRIRKVLLKGTATGNKWAGALKLCWMSRWGTWDCCCKLMPWWHDDV